MRARWPALLVVLLLGCISDSDDDRDKDRPKAEERARRECVAEAHARGLRVEKVGRIEKIQKKQYEVRLRIEPRKRDEKKGDDVRVLCRYDDKTRRALIL